MKKIIIVSIGIVILFIGGLFWHFKKSPKSLEIIASKALADEGIDAAEAQTAASREIVSKRTEKSKSFKNPDGTITARLYQNAIHYQDEQGNWQEIDATFRPSDDPDYAYQMRDSIYKVRVKKDFDEAEFLEVTNHGLTYKITAAPLYWENEKGEIELLAKPQKVEGNIKDSSLSFKNAYGPGLDFEIVLDNEKFDKWLVIDSLAALGAPSEALKAGGKVFLNAPLEISFSDKKIQLSQNGKPLLPLTGKISLLSNCSSCSSTELIVTGDFGSFGMREPFYQETVSATETESRHPPAGGSLNWKLSQPDPAKLAFQMDFLTDWDSLQKAQYPVKINADTTYYGEAADGHIRGYANGSYAGARNTSSDCSDTVAPANYSFLGQEYIAPFYYVYRAYLSFDTSAIPDAATVTASTLYVRAYTDDSLVDFLVQIYRYAWVEGLCTNREANYDGAYGGSATLEGTLRNTADGWTSGAWYNMAVATAGINKTGDSKYTLVSKEDVDNSVPTNYEYVQICNAELAGSEPYLEITYTEGGPPSTESDIIIFE